MRPVYMLAALCFAACKGAGADSSEPAPMDTLTSTDTGAPPATELCNGEDDDADGEVDEGFADEDADGVADCVDPCVPYVPPPSSVDADPSCFADPSGRTAPPDPFDLVVAWRWTGLAAAPEVRHVLTTPLVADLDGDGRAEVVVHALAAYDAPGAVVALDGVTGAEVWSWTGTAPLAGLSAADVDGDGQIELVAVAAEGVVVALDADGVERWRGATVVGEADQPVVADLDGDGAPEVLVGPYVLDGATGALLVELVGSSALIPFTAPVAADLDGDGVQEIAYGDVVYEADGAPRFQVSLAGTNGHWWAPVQADGDAAAELGLVGNGTWLIVDGDGAEIVMIDASFPGVGPSCVGDLDGDGEAEVAWIGGSELVAVELDGEELWGEVVHDWSGLAGCAVYDLDADGALDVLVTDEEALRVFDGPTGALLFEDLGRTSATVFETPAVADVDGDGSADLVVPSDALTEGDAPGVALWSHRGGALLGAGPAWLSAAYAVVDVLPDGAVPAAPAPWLDPGTWRGRRASDGLVSLPDLVVLSAEVCFEACDGEAAVTVVVGNAGAAPASASVAVLDGAGVVLGTAPVGELAPGEASGGLVLRVDAAAVIGGSVLVDPDDAVAECREDDPRVLDADCP
jgi:outer membrane protein assembly factor BamB